MSLFHKHAWRLVSAENRTNREWSYTLRKFLECGTDTVIIDICDECKKLRTRIISGKHADNIIRNYEVKK